VATVVKFFQLKQRLNGLGLGAACANVVAGLVAIKRGLPIYAAHWNWWVYEFCVDFAHGLNSLSQLRLRGYLGGCHVGNNCQASALELHPCPALLTVTLTISGLGGNPN
jgi:hypothetical protein